MIKQFIQQGAEEFDERFKCIQGDCAGGGHTYPTEEEPEGGQCQFCAEYLYPIKSFLHARQIALVKHIVESLESNPNEDGSVSPSIQHWIEKKQRQLLEEVKEIDTI